MKIHIALIGMGYVGIQVGIAFSNAKIPVIGFDINELRIKELQNGLDRNREVSAIKSEYLTFTFDPNEIKKANTFIISVPTPLNPHKIPDLYPLKKAAETVGNALKKGDLVVLESTIFPGATRDLLIPILNKTSGLINAKDYHVGYSSERIIPGDEEKTQLTADIKVISGENEEAFSRVHALYSHIPGLLLHKASSLEVAESSKLLENIQRNVNIALMNEFANIMENMDIPFHDVLEAAKTKSNFAHFKPGLVGGHCIPEDPYYLIYRAGKYDCTANLISCACGTNQKFYQFIAQVAVKLVTKQKLALHDAKIALLGMSFKPNVNDIRHSLSINLYYQLKSLGINIVACDPLVDPDKINIKWESLDALQDCDEIILCQAHSIFVERGPLYLSEKIKPNGVFIDIPGVFADFSFRKDIAYWGL